MARATTVTIDRIVKSASHAPGMARSLTATVEMTPAMTSDTIANASRSRVIAAAVTGGATRS